MKLKTYHAGTVRAALKLARVELGDDAVFVGAKEIEQGRFRVTFALGGAGRKSAAAGTQETPRRSPPAALPHWRKFVPPELTDQQREAARRAGQEPQTTGGSRVVEPPYVAERPDIAEKLDTTETPPIAEARDAVGAQKVAAAEPVEPAPPAPDVFRAEMKAFLIETFSELRAELRAELCNDLAGEFARAPSRAPDAGLESRLEPLRSAAPADWFRRLAAAGVPSTAALDLVAGLDSETDAGALRGRIAERLADALRIEATLGPDPAEGPLLAAFVGPPGGGKTLTIVKLALREGLARGRRVRLVSAGDERIGGRDLLETYASLLRLELTTADEPDELARIVDALRRDPAAPELILIDTPGGAAEADQGEADLAAALRSIDGLTTHLTLDASAGFDESLRAARRYAGFAPNRLLPTRTDALAGWGALWGLAARLTLPLSYFGCGQQAPEDLRPASAAAVVDAVLGEG